MDTKVPELEKIYPSIKENDLNGTEAETKLLENGTEINETKKTGNLNQNSPFRKQALLSFGVFMLNLGAGATAGISAILLPQLEKGDHRHELSMELVSWVAAISSFALVFGNLISGYLMERLGRRRAAIVLSSCFVAGWIVIGFSDNIMGLILFGRFVTGFCQGWLGPLGPVFVGEISSPIYRGFFLAALSLGIAAGVFLSHLFGTIMHWTMASVLCGFFPLIAGITIFYTPESPAWLASKNRTDECVLSFQWYRGNSPAMKAELEKMITEESKKDKTKGKLETLKLNIKKPEFWKPLSIMTTFFVITQLSGVNVICAYTTKLMKVLMGRHSREEESNGLANYAMLSIDILRCVSLVIACIFLRRCGRRPMAIFSGVFTSISLIALGIYLYLVKSGKIHHISSFISLGLMAFYIIVSNLGIVPLPWNMVGELFASETKGLGSSISVIMTSIAFFATVKTAPAMLQSFGHHGTYIFYGVSMCFGTIFLYFCLPETRGKTLLQIEEYFRYGKKSEQASLEAKQNGKESVNV